MTANNVRPGSRALLDPRLSPELDPSLMDEGEKNRNIFDHYGRINEFFVNSNIIYFGKNKRMGTRRIFKTNLKRFKLSDSTFLFISKLTGQSINHIKNVLNKTEK